MLHKYTKCILDRRKERKMKKAVTLKDIAIKTGYSINTVSHALNDKPDISDSTKKIIKESAAELGYIANSAASSLRSGVSLLIAIIVPDISNPHFAVTVKELELIVNEQDYTLMILNTDEDPVKEQKALRTAVSKGVDGIILCPCQRDDESIRFLRASGVPYVLMNRFFDTDQDSYVVPDNVHGGYAAVKHLLDLGHRQLLFINGAQYLSSARDRLAGARLAVEEAGLPAETLRNEEAFGVQCQNSKAVEEILGQNMDCTAIVTFNDMIAIETIFLLEKMGLEVPEDRSVVGFDNIQDGYKLPTGLTGVCPCCGTMAVELAAALFRVMEDRADQTRTVLDTHLVVRRTTKPLE